MIPLAQLSECCDLIDDIVTNLSKEDKTYVITVSNKTVVKANKGNNQLVWVNKKYKETVS